jgi:two-component system OmpR family response regulator
MLSAPGLEMDLLRRQVLVRGEEVRLTSREFQILEVLLRNAGRVVTRSMLLEAVWDYRFDPQTNIVDQHGSRLRQKLGDDGTNSIVETVRGVGYRVRN